MGLRGEVDDRVDVRDEIRDEVPVPDVTLDELVSGVIEDAVEVVLRACVGERIQCDGFIILVLVEDVVLAWNAVQ